MKSLFLKMLLWFCATNALLVGVIVFGYELSNPDQLPYFWPRVGKGAIVSAARTAIDTYERGGSAVLTRYEETLLGDTGISAALFDSANRQLDTRVAGPKLPARREALPDAQLVLRLPGRLAGIRLSGQTGESYTFVAMVPRREPTGFWSRIFAFLLIAAGTVLCYLLARHVTAPVVQLRELTAKLSRGDLGARVTSPNVLRRKDEIGGLADDFNHMAERIEKLMQAQNRLIADVSHELRSPITRLGLALGLVRRSRDGDAGAALARMEREVERLNSLIEQLLTLSRLESLDEPPSMEILDLGALVREVAGDADFEAAGMNRGVRVAECAECRIRGARDLIRSAVENVVRNAVKFTDPNTDVEIRLVRASGASSTIVVQDRGPGAPADALAHIFEPFYRADDARDRRQGGVGLGLAITQQIVTLHGGSVSAANRNGSGLELRLTLPNAGER